MNYYFTTDDRGFLVQQGTYHLAQEWEFLQTVLPNIQQGLPEGLTGYASPPDTEHRWHVPTAGWVEIPKNVEDLWAAVRYQRDKLIAATDWRATRSIVERRRLHPAWAEYRNALRDVTLQPNPTNITWPQEPLAPTFADEDPQEYPIFEGNPKFEIFSVAERAAILLAAQTNMDIMLLLNRLTGAAYITYEDPEMEQGLHLLVQSGLLTQDRKEAIVQQMLPPALRE